MSLRYSSEIQIRLIFDTLSLEVSSCFNNVCVVVDPVDLPPGPAQFYINIDGQEWLKPVYLDEGVAKNCECVSYTYQTGSTDTVPF